MENSKRDKGKIICAFSYTVTSTVSPGKISSSTSITMEMELLNLNNRGKTSTI
jgi:hypothetical protein